MAHTCEAFVAEVFLRDVVRKLTLEEIHLPIVALPDHLILQEVLYCSTIRCHIVSLYDQSVLAGVLRAADIACHVSPTVSPNVTETSHLRSRISPDTTEE